jgi:flagellar FliJ protein
VKRFHFDLEKVLELRLYREQETEIELGRAIGALTAIENRIADLARERIKAGEERFSGGYGAAEIRSYDLYILRLDKTRDLLLEEAAQAELKVEEARKVYLEASRDRKVIDKLKEIKQKEHRKTMLTEEVKMLDDISGGSRARTMVSQGT